ELVRLLAGNTSLSVPSSSGKGLQLERMEMHQRPPRPSFSPLFIGEGSSTLISPLTARPIASPFSPLFIGEGSSTFCSERRRSQVRLLSVPSSSGKGLQRGKNDAHRGRCDLSVPSSSGKGLQLPLPGALLGGKLGFQSPLHRGRVFNSTVRVRMSQPYSSFQSPLHRGRVFNSCSHRPLPPYKPLSVPSSSGKGLQRSQPRWCWPPPAVTFSPLFIGEGSSTNSRWIPRFASMSFQSPLHRGRVFNKRWYHWLVPSLFLSVPSSSGKGLQRSPRWAARCGKESLSVPSSSGKGLQRDQRLAAQPRQEAFSPLFIGEGSST